MVVFIFFFSSLLDLSYIVLKRVPKPCCLRLFLRVTFVGCFFFFGETENPAESLFGWVWIFFTVGFFKSVLPKCFLFLSLIGDWLFKGNLVCLVGDIMFLFLLSFGLLDSVLILIDAFGFVFGFSI